MAEKIHSLEIADMMTDLVLTEAKNAEMEAGYGGRMDDGGASDLRRQVLAYRAGWNQEVPQGWTEFYKQALRVYQQRQREKDPDYKKYLELKNKFEK